jgi:protein-S-isoprenylcysteine O-methyltransferase Ste14
MNTNVVFKILFFLLFAALLAIRLFFGWRARRAGKSSWSAKPEAVKREGWLSILLRPVMFLALLAVVGLYVVLPEKTDWMYLPLPAWIRWAGVGLGIAGELFLIWVHHTLREYWSTVLQLRQSHALITWGPYRFVRHPMYSALTLCFIGLALVSAAWPLLLLTALTLPFFYRISGIEEVMMIEQFDEAYRAYRMRTGRFLPRFTGPLKIRSGFRPDGRKGEGS